MKRQNVKVNDASQPYNGSEIIRLSKRTKPSNELASTNKITSNSITNIFRIISDRSDDHGQPIPVDNFLVQSVAAMRCKSIIAFCHCILLLISCVRYT